ncbi:MAG: HDOD domain-containing protein, partial [Sulfurimonadaceae bacterium]|nr:HDOD domain-containing protein [Sulfurimonadaceae bacterium]
MENILVYTLDSFPPLKESVQRLNAFFLEPEIDRKAFAEVIESDPMLYSDVLHYINAPYYGFRSQIKSIQQAISLVGVMMVRGFAMKSTLKSYTENDMSPYGITMGQWLQTMQKQQHFLYRWLMAEDSTLLSKLGGVMFMLEMGRLAVSYVLTYTNTSHTFSSPN